MIREQVLIRILKVHFFSSHVTLTKIILTHFHLTVAGEYIYYANLENKMHVHKENDQFSNLSTTICK